MSFHAEPMRPESHVASTSCLPQTFTQELFFPDGLVGFPEAHRYALVVPPQNITEPHFLFLKSLEIQDLCFIVVPLQGEDSPVEAQDLSMAFEELNLHPDEARVFCIATPQRQENRIHIAVNLRAPVILDLNSLQGWQYIFQNRDYPLRHLLAQMPMLM